ANRRSKLFAPRQNRLQQQTAARDATAQLDEHHLNVAYEMLDASTNAEVVCADKNENLLRVGLNNLIEPRQGVIARVTRHSKTRDRDIAELPLPGARRQNAVADERDSSPRI